MRRTNNHVGEVASCVARFVTVATAVNRFARRIGAAIRNRARTASAIGQMNDRQLQDIGLSPTPGSTLNDGFASAEAQLGMVR